MQPEIKLEEVYKKFGDRMALQNVNLHLGVGMFGLLGHNGAGKTTMMRILSTLLSPSSGEVSVCGIPIKQAARVRACVGYLPQDFSFYPQMSVYDALDYLGVLSDMPAAERKERVPQVLREVNLEDCSKLRVRALSGGMRRRLGIAQAILHDPKVLIVDEPTAGLDPEERVRFRELLSSFGADKVVLLSTHIVEDVEKTCENLAVLDQGKIIYTGAVSSFVGEYQGLEDAYIHRIGGRG